MLILSAVSGVLATKLLDRRSIGRNKSVLVYFLAILLSVFLTFIYELLGQSTTPPKSYLIISTFINSFENSAFLQCILITIETIFIIFLNAREDRKLSFTNYSKKIIEFTKNIHEYSKLTIVAGDMDFLGGIKLDKIDVPVLMDDNNEYQQLLNLWKNTNGLQIRILCSHGLSKEQELLNSIINGTTSPKILYNKYRTRNSLSDLTFQQLLRIGKIRVDFGSSVEIRFYNSDNDDKGFRARFIDNSGIVYRKEGVHSKIVLEHQDKFSDFKLKRVNEELYSVNNLNLQEIEYYGDMFSLKWESCDNVSCQKVVSFCEALYRFTNNNSPRFHMALVYVNSYEVARKKEKRKEFPPLGVMYLAASVRQNPDWDVDIIAVDEKTVNKELESWRNYDVIGISITSSYSYNILKHCYNASKRKPDVITVVGGYQAEKFSNNVFQDFDADIIFKGEGENSIQSFCSHYEDRNYAAIEGIIYRDINKNIHATDGARCIDVDKIPTPARDLLPQEDIVMTDRLAGTEFRMVHMLFSRGCAYNCYYCAANQDQKVREIRYRDKLKIVEEIQDLIRTYAIEGFSIIDDCFLTDRRKAIEICEYIAQQNLGLKWSLAARVDNIDDEVLTALHNAGCIEIKFGVETGSDELLKKMNKKATVADAEAAIRNTKKHDIGVKLFIITGLPFENDSTHQETKSFLEKMYTEHLVDRVSLLRYAPLAGSYIYSQPEKFGVKKDTLIVNNFTNTQLYRRSYDWWSEKMRYKDCERWYKDINKLIEDLWGDK